MSSCPGCGAHTPPAARFCPECGSALTPSAQAFQAVGAAESRGAAEQGQALCERVQRLATRAGDADAERRAGERLAVLAR